LALDGASTAGKLLGLANHLERRIARALGDGDISGECAFEKLARMKIGDALAGIDNANCAGQVTLLADRVALRLRELRRIYNRSRRGAFEVCGGIAMATVAGNCF